MNRLTKIIRRVAVLAALVLCSPLLHAQQWNQALIWERTFGDSASGFENANVALDNRGHIHLLGESIGGDRAIYVQVMPNGDSVRQLIYAAPGIVYRRVAVSAEGAASPTLGLLRKSKGVSDSAGEFCAIHCDASGWPVDTVTGAVAYGGYERVYGQALPAGEFALITAYAVALPGSLNTLTNFDGTTHTVATLPYAELSFCSGPNRGYYYSYGDDGGETAGVCSVVVARINSAGEEMWSHAVLSMGRGACVQEQVAAEAAEGGVIFGMHEYIENTDRMAAVLTHIDSNGNVMWQRLVDGGLNRSINISACRATSDGGCIAVGQTALRRIKNGSFPSYDSLQQFYVVRLAADGQVQWEWEYGIDTTDERLTTVAFADDTLVVGGWQGRRLYVARLKVDAAGVGSDDPPTKHSGLSVVPNPVRDRAHITAQLPRSGEVRVELADMRGVVVCRFERGVKVGTLSEEINVGEFPSGRYMVRLMLDGEVVATAALVRE